MRPQRRPHCRGDAYRIDAKGDAVFVTSPQLVCVCLSV